MAQKYALSFDFLLTYAKIGLNVDNFYDFLDTLQPYYIENMSGLAQKAMFVNDPYLETSVGNASQIFFANLPQPTSANQTIFTLDVYRGAALHCGVGSMNNYIYMLNWLEDITG